LAVLSKSKRFADDAFEAVMEFKAQHPRTPWFAAHQELVIRFHADEMMIKNRCEKLRQDCISILERWDESHVDRYSWGSSVQDKPRVLSNQITNAARGASLGLGPHGKFLVYMDVVLFLDGREMTGGGMAGILGTGDLYPNSEMFRRIAVKDLLNDLPQWMRMQVISQSRLDPAKYLGPEDLLIFDALVGTQDARRR
jgi:hypothetical protein